MITIFTICDLNYFENFDIFAKSYIINESNKDKVKYIHFFIYKEKSERKIIIDKINKHFNQFIDFKFIKYENTNINFRFFCCHFRFEAFNILKQNDKNKILIYCDIDAYINKSLFDKVNILEESVYFFIRNNKYKDVIINNTNFGLKKEKIQKIGRTYFLSGVIVIKNNKIGGRVINKILKTYNNNHKEWFADQKTLDKVFFSCKFKIGILDRYYFDLTLNKENSLFLCKGQEFPEDRKEWVDLLKKLNNKFNKDYLIDE